MAVQFHVAFSAEVNSVCGFDAQPYHCAGTRFPGDNSRGRGEVIILYTIQYIFLVILYRKYTGTNENDFTTHG